jgi:hypothetical protein
MFELFVAIFSSEWKAADVFPSFNRLVILDHWQLLLLAATNCLHRNISVSQRFDGDPSRTVVILLNPEILKIIIDLQTHLT